VSLFLSTHCGQFYRMKMAEKRKFEMTSRAAHERNGGIAFPDVW